MTQTWSFIGELGPGGELDWGGDASGNVPTGSILPDLNDRSTFSKILHLALEGKFSGKQVDWGAYALKVNGPQLVALLEDWYRDGSGWDPQALISQYIDHARAMGEGDCVALVAAEL